MHRILWDLGGFQLPTYGVSLVVGFILSSWLLKREGNRLGRDGEKLVDLAVVTLLISLVGAKALLIIVDFDYYLANPKELLGTLRAAGVLYGGLIVGALGSVWYMRRHKMPVWDTLDIMAPFVALAIGIGRLGCLAAGCCHGIAYNGPFHLVFPEHCDAPAGIGLFPSQPLAFLNGLMLFAILLWALRKRKFPGQIACLFFMLYSLTRAVMEIWRGDEVRGLWSGISTSQIIASVVFVIAIILYVRLGRKK